MIFIDFETRSRVKIKQTGASVYARDESTEPLCLAWLDSRSGEVGLWVNPKHNAAATMFMQRGDGSTVGNRPNDLVVSCPDIPYSLLAEIENGREFHAHNAAFENHIWQHVMVKRFGWPELPIDRLFCTAAKCAALSLPRSLGEAGAALGCDVQKSKEGHNVMMKLCRPRKPSKDNPNEWCEPDTHPEDFQTLYRYCIDDVRAEAAIDKATRDLDPASRRLWLLDRKINERGIPIDLDSVRNAKAVSDAKAKEIAAELGDLTGGEVTSVKQTAKLLDWVNRHGADIPDLKKATVDEEVERLRAELKEAYEGNPPEAPPRPIALMALRLRQQGSKASTAKLDAMLRRADGDGRIRDAHLWHGANTGRWSGKGVQFQNMTKAKVWHKEGDKVDENREADLLATSFEHGLGLVEWLYGDPLKAVSGAIRSMVKAEEGKKFIVCDFASIEARVLAWLAGEQWVLEAFRRGDNLYKIQAASIFNLEDWRAIEKNTQEYGVGKVAILGLGYQMGATRFKETCYEWGAGEISDELAIHTVDTFRSDCSRIVQFWWSLEAKAVEAVQSPGLPTAAGRIQFIYEDRFLYMILPSGRRIAYCDPRVEKQRRKGVSKRTGEPYDFETDKLTFMGCNTYANNRWMRCSTHGGKLAENATQGSSADFMAHALHNLEDNEYPPIFHVHDEAAVEVPDDSRYSVDEVERLMCDTPAWAEGCPIEAEGFEAKRYRK